MAKKTIVGEVAGTVTEAVVSAIDAIAHPVTTAAKARRGFGRTVTSTKRKVTVKKKKAAKKAARKAVSKTKRTTKRAAVKTKRAVRKAAKKATKRLKRR